MDARWPGPQVTAQHRTTSKEQRLHVSATCMTCYPGFRRCAEAVALRRVVAAGTRLLQTAMDALRAHEASARLEA